MDRASGESTATRPEHRPNPEARHEFALGDTLVLYTDGLVERNPRLAGDAALRELLASLTFANVDELISQLEASALGTPRQRLPDDTAVLAIQVTAPTPGGGDLAGTGPPALVHALRE